MANYKYKNCTAHDLNTLPDPESLVDEVIKNEIKESYFKGVSDTMVALDALMSWLMSGKIDKALKVRVVAAQSILNPQGSQYIEGKTVHDIAKKYDIEPQAFYALQKHFKISLQRAVLRHEEETENLTSNN